MAPVTSSYSAGPVGSAVGSGWTRLPPVPSVVVTELPPAASPPSVLTGTGTAVPPVAATLAALDAKVLGSTPTEVLDGRPARGFVPLGFSE